MIAYPAILDVPRELVLELAKLLRAERRARGTRKGTRLLTCFRQALLVLVWMRTKGEVEVIVWVPRTRSRHATCTYSWMRPPSRSRRSGRTTAPERAGVPPAGGR